MSRSRSALRLGSAALLQQLHADADARQRRPQLVRGVGEQQLVRAHQVLDAGGGAVEALGQPRHLVLALHLARARRDRRRPAAPRPPAAAPAGASAGAPADRRRPPPPARCRPGSATMPEHGGQRRPGARATSQRSSGRRIAQAGPPRRRPSRRSRGGAAAAAGRPAAAIGRRSVSNSARSTLRRVVQRVDGLLLGRDRRRRPAAAPAATSSPASSKAGARATDCGAKRHSMPRDQHHQQQAGDDGQVELLVEAAHRIASVLRLGEHVAGAAHGDDAARLLGIVLDGRADARDVHVDGAVEGLQRLPP